MEHTILALWDECLNDRPFCRYWVVEIPVQISVSVGVGFLYRVVCIVWLGFEVDFVSKKGIHPSLSGHSIVNFMWSYY